MPPFALRHSAKEEKVRSQFTRPAKSLFNPAELGSKAFSYVSAIPNSFLSFSFLVPGSYPISQSLDPTDHQSITQSLIRSAHQICQSPLVGFAFSGSLRESLFLLAERRSAPPLSDSQFQPSPRDYAKVMFSMFSFFNLHVFVLSPCSRFVSMFSFCLHVFVLSPCFCFCFFHVFFDVSMFLFVFVFSTSMFSIELCT
jgi:hypothetical protein